MKLPWELACVCLICICLMVLWLPRQALGTPPRRFSHHTVHTRRRVERGVASWYGPGAQGHEMASGQPFNEHALTAATHRNLPLGTKVKVTNLRNGRSTTLKVKDRLPARSRRTIDLSKAAAAQLGFVHRGLAPVKIQVVSKPHHSTQSRLGRSSSRRSPHYTMPRRTAREHHSVMARRESGRFPVSRPKR